MAKRSKRKNIILTNLPAAIALLLMAAALKITLKFSFFVSLLILIIIYFILGVLIELITDKINTKKKKEELFKKYAEGKSGQLPAFDNSPEEDEIAYEVKPQKKADEVSGKVRRTVSVGSLYETEEAESPAFVRKEEGSSEEPAAVKEEEIPEKAIASFRDRDTVSEPEPELEPAEEPQPEPESVAEEVTAEDLADGQEEEDSFLNIRISDLKDASENSPASDNPFEELFGKKLSEMAADTGAEEEPEAEIEAKDGGKPEAAEAAEAETIPEEPDPAVTEEIEAEPVSEGDMAPMSEIPTEEDPADAPESEDVQEAEPEAAADEEIEEIREESETELSEKMPEIPEADEELIEALKDVGAIREEPAEDIPREEAEARRSLFDETDDFDAGFAERVKKNTSIIFGSVPDTEDDFEYIPASDPAEPPVTAQKGKVKVDSKKIDDLYSFKKSKSGEKFFGRRKR
jgi:hypothetical protein